jgi:hypothetical protein
MGPESNRHLQIMGERTKLFPMKFFKYHALGNDYLVIEPKAAPGL